MRTRDFMSCRKGDMPPSDLELTGGHWQTRGMVRVWVRHECVDCGEYLLPGDRCDTCLTWAIRAARDADWASRQWANRHVIWTILDARKEREEAA